MIYRINSKIYEKISITISIGVAMYFSISDITINGILPILQLFAHWFIIIFIINFYNTRESTIRKKAIQSNNHKKLIEALTAYSGVNPIKLLMNMFIVNQRDTRSIIVTNSLITEVELLSISNNFINLLINNTDIPMINEFEKKLDLGNIIMAKHVLKKLNKSKNRFIDFPIIVHHLGHLLSLSLLDGTIRNLLIVILINFALIVSYYLYLILHHKDNIKHLDEDTQFQVNSMLNSMLGFFSYANFITCKKDAFDINSSYNNENVKVNINSLLEPLKQLSGDEFITGLINAINKIIAVASRDIHDENIK